jgi:TatD DNase family protein
VIRRRYRDDCVCLNAIFRFTGPANLGPVETAIENMVQEDMMSDHPHRDPAPAQLIDTHCHLTSPPLADAVPAVLARATAAGVTRIIAPSYDPASWPEVAALAAAHPGVVLAAYGLHPWVADQPLDLDTLASHLRAPGAVALGEVGLDTKVESSALDQQLPVLEAQLALAHDLQRPVILHCRGAFEELLALLARFTPRLRGVIHAYSRGPELAGRFLDLGLHLGIGGAATRPRARQLRSTLASAPLERLLLETDAPSIGLEGVMPADTEPRHVQDVAAAIADARGDTLEHVAAVTTDAAVNLFGL